MKEGGPSRLKSRAVTVARGVNHLVARNQNLLRAVVFGEACADTLKGLYGVPTMANIAAGAATAGMIYGFAKVDTLADRINHWRNRSPKDR